MKLLLLDNYDSFTYNLYDYLCQLGTNCTVIRNDQTTIAQIKAQNFDAIVLSPGPKRPNDAGILMELIENFYIEKPILGICLGMQAIGEFFGAKLVHATVPMHGKTSWIQHGEAEIFKNIPNPTQVMRYHSLLLKDLPTCLKPTAWTDEKELMALQHETLPIWGMQFHPESILTTNGLEMLDNWVKICQKSKIVLK